jgi:predicted dehydrogenase
MDYEIRHIAEAGGGGLLDIGCYNSSLSRFIFDAAPRRVMGIMEYDPRFNTDRLTSGILDFGRGTATFTCSTQLPESAQAAADAGWQAQQEHVPA